MKAAIQEELNAFILDWLKQGVPQEKCNRFPPETLATLLSWSLFGAAIAWSHNPTKSSQAVMAAQVVDVLI